MPFTKFTNLDFDQIKTSIKDYIRANSDFTDFDFEGSNFSVLIDTLAYNTYITAFNSNMIVNESFLDSATVRENVVSLARNIGYVPRSRTAAQATVSFDVTTASNTPTLTLQAGLVCVGTSDNSSYVFSIPETITTVTTQQTDTSGNIISSTGSFNDIVVYQGTYLTKSFTVDGSLDQRFILENSFIDTSTIKVYIKGLSDTGLGKEYRKVDNILNITDTSETYLIQEVTDERYELLFGDGIFGIFGMLKAAVPPPVAVPVPPPVAAAPPPPFAFAFALFTLPKRLKIPFKNLIKPLKGAVAALIAC